MLLGIDGGGTKTELALATPGGEVVAHLVGEGCNAADLGAERAGEVLRAQIDRLLAGQAAPAAIYAGLSGGANPETKQAIRAHLRAARQDARAVEADSDMVVALSAGAETGDAMVVIAGTGSSAYVRHGGSLSQVGGWGFLIDDAGSGFSVGRAVLNAALRAFDGRGPRTALCDLAAARLGMPAQRAIPTLYAGGKRLIASFAPLAFEAAATGDAVAEAILAEAAAQLALLIQTCARRIERPPYLVVPAGGLWRARGLEARVFAGLSEEFELRKSDLPPVYGAVVEAAKLLSIAPGAAFRAAFAASYRALADA